MALAILRAFSARPNLAADTIFIDFVIFWMFVTDLRRIEISCRVAMPRAPEGAAALGNPQRKAIYDRDP